MSELCCWSKELRLWENYYFSPRDLDLQRCSKRYKHIFPSMLNQNSCLMAKFGPSGNEVSKMSLSPSSTALKWGLFSCVIIGLFRSLFYNAKIKMGRLEQKKSATYLQIVTLDYLIHHLTKTSCSEIETCRLTFDAMVTLHSEANWVKSPFKSYMIENIKRIKQPTIAGRFFVKNCK